MIFVYSGGKLVAEYSTKPPPQNPTTKYVATDTLQSVRAITNQDGEVISRRDFLPFGKEIPNSSLPGHSSSLRTNALKYGGEDVRQKFTGYQKDEESQLDFAEARMYENRHARFTAVDPLLASGKSSNPQTFNRYVYVMNSPLNFTDPTGLQAASPVNFEPCPQPCSNPDLQTDAYGNVSDPTPAIVNVPISRDVRVILREIVFGKLREFGEQTDQVLNDFLFEPALSQNNGISMGIAPGFRNRAKEHLDIPLRDLGQLEGIPGLGFASLIPRGTTLESMGLANRLFTYETPRDSSEAVGQFVGGAALDTVVTLGAGGARNLVRNPSPLFSVRGGTGLFGKEGLTIRKYEFNALYQTPNSGPGAGTLFSVNQRGIQRGSQFRFDYGTIHKSNEVRWHSTVRFRFKGITFGSSAQRKPYPTSLRPPFFEPYNN